MVGISLLTLVPGTVGGSEVYARELLRALALHGELEYRVLLPTIAPDAAGGLPHEVVPEYRASWSIAGRLRAMTLGMLRPGPLEDRLRGTRPVHFPLTVPVPRVAGPVVITLHDLQHRDLPSLFSRGERAFRRLGYDRAARRADAVIVPTEFVRERAVERLGLDAARVHVVAHGVDHERFRPGEEEREPILLYPAKGWPHKNHGRLFEALPLIRRERPDLRLVLTGYEGEVAGRRRAARPRPARRARRPLPARGGARLPEPVRGVRPAAARGDGVRLSGRRLAGGLAARGLRRRCRPLRPGRSGRDRRGRAGGARASNT